MPAIVQGNNFNPRFDYDMVTKDTRISYDYPRGLDFKPGSKLYKKLKYEVLRRAQDSYDEMSKKFPTWKKIDESLTAYIPLDDYEKDVLSRDSRKPVSIVVPFSYATLETLLTYDVAAFLNDPIFRYEGMSSEDTIGAAMLEGVVRHQCLWSKVALNLHTMFRDSKVYGFGAVGLDWTRRYGYRTEKKQEGFWSALTSAFRPTGFKRVRGEREMLYEGNRLVNIDPYSYLPDTDAPIHDPQMGEHVGWIERDNYMNLLKRERDGEFFNVKYLRHMASGRSYISRVDDSGREAKHGSSRDIGRSKQTMPVDVIYMFITLIPKEFELGSSEYPEKWLFVLAGDEVVIQAKPLGLNHDLYPVAVSAPDFDGYSATPTSRLEVIYGLQKTLDWLISSHVTNVRKSINDMLVVDPYLINMGDLRDGKPGKLVRMRRAAWGRGVENAVMQLKVNDVTKQHISDAAYVVDMMQRVSAAVDSVMGIMRTSGERRSATESRDSRTGALSRLERAGKVASVQALFDIAYMFGSQTQQLMSKPTYVKITGGDQMRLMADLGVQPGMRAKVGPNDIIIEYDVVPKDGSNASAGNPEIFKELFQIIATQPELYQSFDLIRIFKHIARSAGAKNVDEFERFKPVIAPDQQVQANAQAGNLVPIQEAM